MLLVLNIIFKKYILLTMKMNQDAIIEIIENKFLRNIANKHAKIYLAKINLCGYEFS